MAKKQRTNHSTSNLRSFLHLKFIILYAVLGFLFLFITATLTSELIYSRLKENTTKTLYKNATTMATDYLPRYFSGTLTIPDIRSHLDGMRSYTHSAVWFVDQDGALIVASVPDTYPNAPAQIADFNPAESGSSTYQEGTYHDYFEENVLTIITPVTQGFSPKGYLLVHQSTTDLEAEHDTIMQIAYLTLGILYILSFMILLGFHFFVYRPLRKITEAATEYAAGNLDYQIPVKSQDEIGYLSASLNFMSSQLRDMEEYQKKFVANVSHDFRSPLTSIKGYVSAMADGIIPPEMQEKYLKIILFETDRLTALTQDLLTLNEYDTKHLLLNKEAFDIHDVIKNTAASFEGTCIQKKISIELLFETKHLIVFADKLKIQQVFYNLIDNAIKFSDPNSSITVETTDRGDKVHISVKDYGSGIPRESLNKIWDRFYKIDASRGKDKKGTGLGLAIVKEALQAHNENINVISTEGVGTEFTFFLPKDKS